MKNFEIKRTNIAHVEYSQPRQDGINDRLQVSIKNKIMKNDVIQTEKAIVSHIEVGPKENELIMIMDVITFLACDDTMTDEDIKNEVFPFIMVILNEKLTQMSGAFSIPPIRIPTNIEPQITEK